MTTKLSTKGQVILPKSIRNQKNWEPGMRLRVENTLEGVLLKPMPAIEQTRPEEVFGMLNFQGATKSLTEMDAGVLEEARRCHAGD